MPTCYGYARRSSDYEEQKESLVRQCKRIPEKYEELRDKHGLKWGKIFAETMSATKVGYKERPECVKLFSALNKGDYLIVENLQRLDRGALRQVACLEELRAKKITLVVLDMPLYANGIPLDRPEGQIFILGLGIANAVWGQQQSEGRKRMLARKRAEGKPWTGYPPLGFKWGEDEHGKSIWVPDPESQALIREIVLRHHGIWPPNMGKPEGWPDIAHDFYNRGAYMAGHRGKTNFGKPTNGKTKRYFAILRKRGDRPCGARLHYAVMTRAYEKYVEEFKQGTEFGVLLEDILKENPQRQAEIEFLRKVFARDDFTVKSRPKHRVPELLKKK